MPPFMHASTPPFWRSQALIGALVGALVGDGPGTANMHGPVLPHTHAAHGQYAFGVEGVAAGRSVQMFDPAVEKVPPVHHAQVASCASSVFVGAALNLPMGQSEQDAMRPLHLFGAVTRPSPATMALLVSSLPSPPFVHSDEALPGVQ